MGVERVKPVQRPSQHSTWREPARSMRMLLSQSVLVRTAQRGCGSTAGDRGLGASVMFAENVISRNIMSGIAQSPAMLCVGTASTCLTGPTGPVPGIDGCQGAGTGRAGACSVTTARCLLLPRTLCRIARHTTTP
eukprot:340635-Hanusia_phi.AAC.1